MDGGQPGSPWADASARHSRRAPAQGKPGAGAERVPGLAAGEDRSAEALRRLFSVRPAPARVHRGGQALPKRYSDLILSGVILLPGMLVILCA